MFKTTDMEEPPHFHTTIDPSSSALTSVLPSDARSLIGAECSERKYEYNLLTFIYTTSLFYQQNSGLALQTISELSDETGISPMSFMSAYDLYQNV